MGLIAHPGQLCDIAVDFQGKYAFTVGGSDLCLNMWTIDSSAVATTNLVGGSGIEPYLSLLGNNSVSPEEFLIEMRDYFYYSQIRALDENTTVARKLDSRIPLEEIPN